MDAHATQSNAAPDNRVALLDDALRYLWRAKEAGRTDDYVRLNAHWAAKALVAAGEADIAQIVVGATELCNPALFDQAWNQVRELRDGAASISRSIGL